MKKIIAFTLLSALVVAGIAIAQPRQGGHGCKKGNKHKGMPMILKMADKLELTDKQTEQIEAISVNFKIEEIDLQASIEKEKVLMKSLMHNEEASEREVFAKIDKISALKADSKKMHFSHRKAVQEILTEEQADKLKEIRKNRRSDSQCGDNCEQSEFGAPHQRFQDRPETGRRFRKN